MPSAREFLGGDEAPKPSAAAFLNEKPKDNTELLDTLFGAGEAALSIGSGFILGTGATIAATPDALIEQARKGKLGTPEGTAEAAQRVADRAAGVTFEPRGEKGREFTDAINRVIQESGAMGIPFDVFLRLPAGKQVLDQARSRFSGAPGAVPRGVDAEPPPLPADAVAAPSGEPPGRPFPIAPEPPPPKPVVEPVVPKAETKPPVTGPDPAFPPEAGDISAIGARKSAAAFLADDDFGRGDDHLAQIAPDAESVPRNVQVTERLAAGGKLTPEEEAEFPALAELERSKAVLAEAKAAKQSARAFLDEKPKEEAAPAPAVEPPETPEQAAASEAAAERTLKRQMAAKKRHEEGRSINPLEDDLPTIAGKLGGLSRQALIDLGLDPKDLDQRSGFFRSQAMTHPAVRAKGGISLDAFAEELDQLGYQVRDEYGNIDQTKVQELIDEHLSGKRVYTPEGYAHQAARAAEEKAKLEAPEREAQAAADKAALEEFGPGTLGANSFLNPKAAAGIVDKMLREVMGEPAQYRNLFNPIRDKEQHGVARVERWATGEGAAIRKAFPTKEAREDLTMRIVKNDAAGLTPEQAAIMRKLQANYQAMGEYADAAGAVSPRGLRQNYSPQIWDLRDKNTREYIEAAQAAKSPEDIRTRLEKMASDTGRPIESFSPFLLKRSIPDVIEGMRIGLKPRSLDAADLFETYARSISTAVERGKAIKSLMELQSEDGVSMVIPTDQAPKHFERINNPELEGFRVHPDIAPSVRVLMETNDPGIIAKAWQTLAYTAKRALVSYSLFHPKALLEADIGAGGNPLTAKSRIDAALKMYRDGGLGDVIDKGLANGLKIGAPLEDVLGRDRFKGMIDTVTDVLDKVPSAKWPGGKYETSFGNVTRSFKAIDEKIQKATWNYVHTGLKLDTFVRKFTDLQTKNPKMAEAEIARQAAEFANATFGGLNWERMLDSFQTPTARKVMSEVLSKQGRSIMQSTLFAPDWLVSTVGSWTNALPGAERNALKAQLARRYLMTSAVVTMGLGNLLNYYFAGHSTFENKSNKRDKTWRDDFKAKTEVDLGDGRRMQLAKHFMEVPHMALQPFQFALNKLNPVISEPFEQAFNADYLTPPKLSASGHPYIPSPPITRKEDSPGKSLLKRAEHVGGKFLPITGRGIIEQGPSGLGGFLGFPIYGMTDEQKKKAKAER